VEKPTVKREELAGRGMVWRCSDCRAWCDSGKVRHSKRCDLYGTEEATRYYDAAERPASGEQPKGADRPATPLRRWEVIAGNGCGGPDGDDF